MKKGLLHLRSRIFISLTAASFFSICHYITRQIKWKLVAIICEQAGINSKKPLHEHETATGDNPHP